MDWDDFFADGETLVWEGRPAPRCFTFRNWIHSLFGIVILIAATGWLVYGLHLAEQYRQPAYAWMTVPFLLAGIYLSFGHLVIARLEWEKVFYALSDRRLLAVRGLFRRRVAALNLADVVYVQMKPLGAELGTIRVQCRQRDQRLIVSCIEYPRKLTELLEAELIKNGIDINSRPGE